MLKTHAMGETGRDTLQTFGSSKSRYDNEEGVYVFRCLPHAEKYQSTVPIFAEMGSGNIDVAVEVQGKEDVKVPAGKFNCWKVFLPAPINQTFWFTADEHRYFVKLQVGNVLGVLTKIATRNPGQTEKYKSDDLAVTLPAGWYAYPAQTAVYLLDPDANWSVQVKTTKLEALSKEERESPRAWAEKGLPNVAKRFKDWKVRADSWQPMTIGGKPGDSVVGDYVATDGRPMTQFVLSVFSKANAANMVADCSRDDLERMKKELRPIVESLEVK